MSRFVARESLFKLVYERCVTKENNALTFNIFFTSQDEEQKEYFNTVYSGLEEKFDFLESLISSYSQDFIKERIYKIDLAIMILTSYEILYMPSIPDAASINEAVELAKKYSTEKSAAFINGILATVKKNKEEILENEHSGENN